MLFCDCFVFVMQGFNAISFEMVLQPGKPLARDYETLFCDCIEKISAGKEDIYNNDDIIFFSLYQRFAKPSCNNVLQPSPLSRSGWNTLSHLGLANANTQKRMFYPLLTSENNVKITVIWLFSGWPQK